MSEITRVPLRAALVAERRAVRRALGAGALVSLATVGLAATSAWLIVRAAERPSVLSLTVAMGLVQLFALGKAAGRYLERTETHRAALGAMARLRASTAAALEPLLPAGLGPTTAGTVDTVIGDVERVQDLLTAVAAPLVAAAVAGLVSAVGLGILSWLCAVTLGTALVLVGVVAPTMAARLGWRDEEEARRIHAEVTTIVDDATRHGDEIVGMGDEAWLLARLRAADLELDRAHQRRAWSQGVVGAVTTFVSGVAVIILSVESISAVRAGTMDRAAIAVPVLLAIAALELASAVAPAVVSLRGDLLAAARLGELASIAPPVSEPASPCDLLASPTILVASDVTRVFAEHPVLDRASVALRPGDFVRLQGPSGSGKTTLALILAHFLDPSSGQLSLDDNSFRRLSSRQVREHVGFVDDEPHVFATTLAANLRVARENATDDELEGVCRAAGLGPLLQTLPDGLNSYLGGRGERLSGGERRRLGLARELLAQRSVVILDEPTEGLDHDSAAQVMATIRSTYRDRAVLVITHRAADVPDVTLSLEMRDGTIIATRDDVSLRDGEDLGAIVGDRNGVLEMRGE